MQADATDEKARELLLAGRRVADYPRRSVFGASSTLCSFDRRDHAAHPSFGLLPNLVSGND
jgi:hypothetical protein